MQEFQERNEFIDSVPLTDEEDSICRCRDWCIENYDLSSWDDAVLIVPDKDEQAGILETTVPEQTPEQTDTLAAESTGNPTDPEAPQEQAESMVQQKEEETAPPVEIEAQTENTIEDVDHIAVYENEILYD